MVFSLQNVKGSVGIQVALYDRQEVKGLLFCRRWESDDATGMIFELDMILKGGSFKSAPKKTGFCVWIVV